MASSSEIKRERRPWNKEYDIKLCREVVFLQPYQHSKGSKEGAAVWVKITENLTSLNDFTFTTKSIRDHFNSLVNSRWAKVNAEIRKTGEGTEEQLPEIDVLLDEIISDLDKYNEFFAEKTEEKKEKEATEKENAAKIRKTAMETYGQTKKKERGGRRGPFSSRWKEKVWYRNDTIPNGQTTANQKGTRRELKA